MSTIIDSATLSNEAGHLKFLGNEVFITGDGSDSGINIVDRTSDLWIKGSSPATRGYGTVTYVGMGYIDRDTMILACGSNRARIYTK